MGLNCTAIVFVAMGSKDEGDNIELSNDNKTIKQNGGKWNAVLGMKSVTSYSVKVIERQGHVMIGMAPKRVQLNALNHATCGWFLDLCNGYIHSQNGSRQYTTRIRKGCTAQVFHNKQNGTISFGVNGINQGIAFETIPNDVDLYPCVEINSRNACLELWY
eukprot:TRINITY_DN2890_c0_g3_i2.p1 TRINITY_DN2890_c0_g3~~TRINITY_DN2890_c0_g3_i2.p1  ORF type:complete len:161 (+),score=30.54 TRINITY_DN2890_c0_g3_i2:322-804(+)